MFLRAHPVSEMLHLMLHLALRARSIALWMCWRWTGIDEKQDHGLRVSNWLHLSCGVNLSYQICGWQVCLCENCHMSARWHIEITENEFSIWASCLSCFQYWGCGIWSIILEICAPFAQQKASNVGILFAHIVFLSHSYLKYTIFRGNNMPMCLVADTHSPKESTTLWMVTICIAWHGKSVC